jgi:archaeosine-15-forming tRNA-guanine transglycosylase
MSRSNTYIALQAAIQEHLSSDGTINEVLEALKQTLTLQAQDGAVVETRELNKILRDTQLLISNKVMELEG